jgi:DNA-binding SARP family transcriptional activator
LSCRSIGRFVLAGPVDGAYVTDQRPDALKSFSRRLNSLRIQILGGLSAWTAEGLLAGEAAQPRRLALLALLARAGERGLSRDKLVGFLWPDTDDERARKTLSQALYALRQGSQNEDLFLGTQELRLNPDVVTSDLAEFDTARREGDWTRAVGAYGGPFLDGFHLPGVAEFERWLEDQRQTLAIEYAELLEHLAQQAEQDGQYSRAVGWWRRLSALDPLNARIAKELMQAHVAAGDRAAALRHARLYQALAEQELDLPADREVLALVKRIQSEPAASESPVAVAAQPLVEVALDPRPDLPEPVAAAPPAPRVRRRFPTLLWIPALVLGLIALALALGRPRPRSSGSSPVIMVGHITDYNRTSGALGRPLADMIATDLARAPRVRVISTARVYEILSQLRAGDTVESVLMSAARHAGATELLDGALFDLGQGRIRLDLRRIEVGSGSVLGAYSVHGSDPFSLASRATALLVADLGSTVPDGLIADLTTGSLEAYRAYEAGLRDYYGMDFAAAERHFADALRADSGFAMASYYHALASEDAAVRLARLDDALRRSVHASDRERLIISVRWALSNSAPSAPALADTLAVRYPHELDAQLALGQARFSQEDYLGAARAFERVIEMDSLGLRGAGVRCAACDAYHLLVAGYATVDSVAAARRAAEAWARAQPKNPEPWRQLATLAHLVRDPAAGEQYFNRASSLDTSSTHRHFDRASHLLLAGRYQEVERILRERLAQGVSRNERIDNLWYLTLVLAQQGRFQEALATATRLRHDVASAGSAERDGHPMAITVGLAEAQALRQTGQLRQAIFRFDSLASFSLPGGPPARRASGRIWSLTHLASALAEARDTARLARIVVQMDSLRALSGAVRDQQLPHYVRGLLESARGRLDVALREFAQGSSVARDGFGLPVLERARLSIQLQRPHEAVRLLQRLLQTSYHFYITHPELETALAEAWAAAGNRDSAQAHLAEVDRAWAAADPLVKARLQVLHNRLGI